MATLPKDETMPMPSTRAESVESSSFDNARGTEVEEKVQESEDVMEKDAAQDLSRQKSTAPSEIEYPGTKERLIVFSAVLLAMFLMALDRTIVSTALPSITNEFHSLSQEGWYGSAFLLTASAFQLVFGRIYTFNTPKYVYLTLIALFEIGSVVCGAAPNSVAFIFGRAIAGMGSAGMQAGSVVIITNLVPLSVRPKYMGLFGAMFGIASVAGPLLGGAFTTNVSWRWCFYINLPIGGVAWLAVLFILKPSPPAVPGLTLKQQLAKLDLLGEFFLLPCIVCLLLALQWGGAQYPWSDYRVIVCLVLFGCTLIAFVAVQVLMPETATVPGRLVKNRSIIAGMLQIFCLYSSMMVAVYYLPIYFQALKGTSAVRSGIDTIPLILSLVVGSIFSGIAVSRIGYYTPFAMASSIIMPIGAGLLTTLKINSSTGTWIGFQILFGFGIGLGMQQASLAAQTVLARKDVPSGIAMIFFVQSLGGAIFISVAQNQFADNLVQGLTAILPGFDPTKVGATDLRHDVSPQTLPEVLGVYQHALRKVFIIGVILACLTALGSFSLEWKSVKGKQGPGKGKGKPDEEKAKSVEEGKVEEPVEEIV